MILLSQRVGLRSINYISVMKLYLKALLILIIGLLGFSLFVMGLHWIAILNPYYGISVLLGGALIIIYMIIYQGLKSRE